MASTVTTEAAYVCIIISYVDNHLSFMSMGNVVGAQSRYNVFTES